MTISAPVVDASSRRRDLAQPGQPPGDLLLPRGTNDLPARTAPDPTRPRSCGPTAPTSHPPTKDTEQWSPTRPAPTPTDPTSGHVPPNPDHGPPQTNIGWGIRGGEQGRNLRPLPENRRNSRQPDAPIHLLG